MVAPATPSAIPTDAPTTMRGNRICSMTSCSVRVNSPTSKPTNARTMDATWLMGMWTGPRLRETSAPRRISRPSTAPPIARRAFTPAWR